jgi:hypothetical protein
MNEYKKKKMFMMKLYRYYDPFFGLEERMKKIKKNVLSQKNNKKQITKN